MGGGRVAKQHPRIEALGTIDELNAFLGWAAVLCRADFPWLQKVQASLFDLGAELASPGDRAIVSITARHIEELEALIDATAAKLPQLKQFILPGGSEAAARLHIARSVARRAERRVAALHEKEPVRPVLLAYLNRLSDLLFVAARAANHAVGVPDVPYVADTSSQDDA